GRIGEGYPLVVAAIVSALVQYSDRVMKTVVFAPSVQEQLFSGIYCVVVEVVDGCALDNLQFFERPEIEQFRELHQILNWGSTLTQLPLQTGVNRGQPADVQTRLFHFFPLVIDAQKTRRPSDIKASKSAICILA